jgi:mannose-1-phosphate guanylyltransferase
VANNKENLVSLADRTTEEQREIARQGGIASGEARKKKKALREKAKLLMSLPIQDLKEKNKLNQMGIEDDDIDLEMMSLVHIYNIIKKENFNSVGAFNSIKELVDNQKEENETKPPVINVTINNNDKLKETFFESEEEND